ncbi:MAG: phosphotransferase [Bdellovibrionales bacterium]
MCYSFLSEKYSKLFDPRKPALGTGASADVWALDDRTVLRLYHGGALRDFDQDLVQYDQWCARFNALLKAEAPDVPTPNLIEEDVLKDPCVIFGRPYYSWQIYHRVSGTPASEFLRQRGVNRPLIDSLSKSLLAFHATASVVASRRDDLSVVQAFTDSRLGKTLSQIVNHEDSAMPSAHLILSALMDHIDRKSLKSWRAIHGDAHPNNFFVSDEGVITGLIDAQPCIAPVEFEFSNMSSFPTAMLLTASSYKKAWGKTLDVDCIQMISAAIQIAWAMRGQTKRFQLATNYLDLLSKGGLPKAVRQQFCTYANNLRSLCPA